MQDGTFHFGGQEARGQAVRFPMNTTLRHTVDTIIRLICWTLVACVAHAQNPKPQTGTQLHIADKAHTAAAISKIKSGNFVGTDADLIAKAGAVEAIPALKEQFLRKQDATDKAKIAQVLLKLGDKDDSYWNFLVDLVTPALESDAPDFMSYDSQGKSQPGPSPEFSAWATAHNLPPNGSIAEDSIYIFPGEVMLLGLTGDPRAIPLLRRGLQSRNHMIVNAAALGLAELQDKDSVPLIVEACQQAPKEAAAAIASSLVYFDTPDAQAAVDAYVPKNQAKVLRDAKAQGKKTPFSY